MDRFAGRKGGSRNTEGTEGTSKDSSMWHYLPSFNEEMIRIIHNDFTPNAGAEMCKCRALSTILAEHPLAANAHKYILVNREAAIYSFGDKGAGSLLGYCGLSLGQGITQKEDIVAQIGEKPSIKSLSQDTFDELIKRLH